MPTERNTKSRPSSGRWNTPHRPSRTGGRRDASAAAKAGQSSAGSRRKLSVGGARVAHASGADTTPGGAEKAKVRRPAAAPEAVVGEARAPHASGAATDPGGEKKAKVWQPEVAPPLAPPRPFAAPNSRVDTDRLRRPHATSGGRGRPIPPSVPEVCAPVPPPLQSQHQHQRGPESDRRGWPVPLTGPSRFQGVDGDGEKERQLRLLRNNRRPTGRRPEVEQTRRESGEGLATNARSSTIIVAERPLAIASTRRNVVASSGGRGSSDPPPRAEVFAGELAPDEELGSIVEAVNVEGVDVEAEERERRGGVLGRFSRKEKCAFASCAAAIAAGLGVGLGVGLPRAGGSAAGTEMVIATVARRCNLEGPWRRVGRELTHEYWWSNATRPGYISSISRAFGSSLSLSADGSVLAVAGRFSDSVSVFRLENVTGSTDNANDQEHDDNDTNGNAATLLNATSTVPGAQEADWVKLGSDIIESRALFGPEQDFYEAISCAILSGDGRRVAAAFPHYNSGTLKRRGFVKVYEWREDDDGDDNNIGRTTDGEWSALGEAFLGNTTNAYLGDRGTVDLSYDGGIIAIGDYRSDDRKGRVQVFRYQHNQWRQVGDGLVGYAAGDEFGEHISLAAEALGGLTLAAGTPNANANTGLARVFRYTDDGEWELVGNALKGGDGTCGFGHQLSLSSNGRRLAVWSSSSPVDDEGRTVRCIDWSIQDSGGGGNDKGQVRVYELDDGDEEWVQISPGFEGEEPGESFGWALDLSRDGRTLSIGAEGSARNGPDAGYVVTYHDMGGNWTRVSNDINGRSSGYWAGDAVSVSHSGEHLAVGAPTDFLLSPTTFEENPQDTSGVVTVYRHCLP